MSTLLLAAAWAKLPPAPERATVGSVVGSTTQFPALGRQDDAMLGVGCHCPVSGALGRPYLSRFQSTFPPESRASITLTVEAAACLKMAAMVPAREASTSIC